jgi:hypothetical protein
MSVCIIDDPPWDTPVRSLIKDLMNKYDLTEFAMSTTAFNQMVGEFENEFGC